MRSRRSGSWALGDVTMGLYINISVLQKKEKRTQKTKERKLASASRSFYILAVIIIKFSSKFLKIQKMIFPIV